MTPWLSQLTAFILHMAQQQMWKETTSYAAQSAQHWLWTCGLHLGVVENVSFCDLEKLQQL